jgi:NAD(P)-dependent dehydrogenase (short-subunit alcohol dehydrogenase family)
LRQSDAGRALFVTSGAVERCRPFWGIYSASKAALDALVRTYAAEIDGTNVTANLINPGALRTKMRAQAVPGEDPQTLQPPEALAPEIVRLVSPDHTANGIHFTFPTGATRSVLFDG